jgi:large subunit ribosomal protein L2
MALRKYKPTTAGTRWRIGNAYAEITTDTPEKSLLERKIVLVVETSRVEEQ